jgi:hypothetical protein
VLIAAALGIFFLSGELSKKAKSLQTFEETHRR